MRHLFVFCFLMTFACIGHSRSDGEIDFEIEELKRYYTPERTRASARETLSYIGDWNDEDANYTYLLIGISTLFFVNVYESDFEGARNNLERILEADPSKMRSLSDFTRSKLLFAYYYQMLVLGLREYYAWNNEEIRNKGLDFVRQIGKVLPRD